MCTTQFQPVNLPKKTNLPVDLPFPTSPPRFMHYSHRNEQVGEKRVRSSLDLHLVLHPLQSIPVHRLHIRISKPIINCSLYDVLVDFFLFLRSICLAMHHIETPERV